MLLDDARRTVRELVLRSGNVDVLRTQLGCVGRNFHWFIGQLRFNEVFNIALGDDVHVMDVLNRARSSMVH